MTKTSRDNTIDVASFSSTVIDDYRIAVLSRQMSIVNRKEVLSGKGKFGISGEGKELAQIALAKAFEKGDFRAGYYRDQTILLALGELNPRDYFAQLFADPENDPFSRGRQMVCHFSTPFVDEQGQWLDLNDRYNQTSGISSTAGQVARAMGLAYATKKFKQCPELKNHPLYNDRAVTFMTIGDGSTSEGPFWELMNASAVEGIPLATNIWDDGYAISVPVDRQTVKGSVSRALEGFLKESDSNGISIYVAKGWDYPGLCEMYLSAIPKIRDSHIPAILHVQELTQPLGHSTSGSHSRYKSKERLRFEKEKDCNSTFRRWLLENDLATDEQLVQIEKEAKEEVTQAKNEALTNLRKSLKSTANEVKEAIEQDSINHPQINTSEVLSQLDSPTIFSVGEIVQIAKNFVQENYLDLSTGSTQETTRIVDEKLSKTYSTHLYSENNLAATKIIETKPCYSDASKQVNGFEIINTFFDVALSRIPEMSIFGEDVGHLGGVNQGAMGLQEKYGVERVFDTGIREWTIIGQAIGMAMRGLRPIAEVQYLDYLPYALAPLTDDLATLRYRTAGQQQSPCIIRTRGHRLEGIWHTGSPMSMILGSLRGMCICVPRDFTRAAGLYNTLLESNDPGLVIEPLVGYRKKEILPDNIDEIKIPVGQTETIREGKDLTLVTYGSCVSYALDAADRISKYGVEVEIIDVQTLFPFDLKNSIVESLKKTGRLLIVDEDLPGGASGFILDHVLHKQNGFGYLETAPEMLTSTNHRTPYGDNGSYLCKPTSVTIFEKIVTIMRQINPGLF